MKTIKKCYLIESYMKNQNNLSFTENINNIHYDIFSCEFESHGLSKSCEIELYVCSKVTQLVFFVVFFLLQKTNVVAHIIHLK